MCRGDKKSSGRACGTTNTAKTPYAGWEHQPYTTAFLSCSAATIIILHLLCLYKGFFAVVLLHFGKIFSIRVWVLVCLCAYFLLSWRPMTRGKGLFHNSQFKTFFFFSSAPLVVCLLWLILLGCCFWWVKKCELVWDSLKI
mgnify:CR=1 FL=1